MDPRNLLDERVAETTTALRLAKSALGDPAPGASIASIQPRLRPVVSRNRAFLAKYGNGPFALNVDTLNSLQEATDRLDHVANTPPAQWRGMVERMGDAVDLAPIGLGLGAGVLVAILILVLLISKR